MRKELDHEEKLEDTYEDLRDEWLPYSGNDVLSLGLVYAGDTMKNTGSGMKDCLSLLLSGKKCFVSRRFKVYELHR